MTICKTKKWGSSLGVVIPKSVVDEMYLTENQEIEIDEQLKGRFIQSKAKTKAFLDMIQGHRHYKVFL